MKPYSYPSVLQNEFKPRTIEILDPVAMASNLSWKPGETAYCLLCTPCCANWLPELEQALRENNLLQDFIDTPLRHLGEKEQHFELKHGRLVLKSAVTCIDFNTLAAAIDTLV